MVCLEIAEIAPPARHYRISPRDAVAAFIGQDPSTSGPVKNQLEQPIVAEIRGLGTPFSALAGGRVEPRRGSPPTPPNDGGEAARRCIARRPELWFESLGFP